ncbi:thiol reductant ABC exporter subunit CydC [Raoultibacter phocaeensis]|uniref:thiol reductant ABC exporter subunit CydC n=1 Tax=Raoultibacter phocaeensis TaxID=2479841 RepID=UPI001118863D|nr:thiol reductant ABC exporter subunit CydC [Raoultibacter phocaeensis]
MFNKRLLAMVPTAMRYILANVLFQWIALVANIAVMVTIGLFIYDTLGRTEAAMPLVQVLAVAAVAIAVRMLCTTFAQSMSFKAASIAKKTMRQAVYDKLARLGPSYAENVSTSEAVQMSVEGTEQLEVYFGSYLPQVLYAIAAPVTLFCFLAPWSFPAAVVLFVCVPLIPVSIIAIQRIARRVVRTYWGKYADLGATFLENLQGLTTLKIYRADGARHERMNEEAEGFRQATMKLLSMQLNSINVMDLLAYGGAAAGIIVVLFQFAGGAASLAAAFIIVFLSAEFFIPMRTLGSFFHTAMNGIAAAEKMFDLLDTPEPERGNERIDPANCSISCRSLTYSYDGKRTVLDHIYFDVKQNRFTAIVGESGSGKSTLAGILSGKNAAFSGTVTIGGTDVNAISRESLMESLTTVSFSSYLFKGSVRSNLLMGNPEATDEELWAVLDRCRLGQFVRASGGLDMPLAEQAANLSGGQRQRLAMARALLHDSAIYLFDEATSNIDAESEAALLEAIDELARTKTVIMISHRLAAIKGADCIYAMEDGRIAEVGTHDELLAHGSVYARLWNQQASLEAYVASEEAACGAAEHAVSLGGSAASCGVQETDGCGVGDERRQSGAPAVSECGSGVGGAAVGLRADDLVARGTVTAAPDAAVSAEAPRRKRSNLSIMLRLIALVGPLLPVMVLAIALGVGGFLAAIFLTTFGAYGITDAAGMPAGIGFATACVLVTVCGIVRGPLRYGEQLCNHFIAFKLLALIRDKVFGALRSLAPAKLEGRDKGNLISLITSDIELLEVFYAHTISPIAIAIIVSLVMAAFIGSFSVPLALLAVLAYAVIGIVVPLAASRASGRSGRAFRDQVGDMNTFVLDSLRGLRETLQYGFDRKRSVELGARTEGLASVEAGLKRSTARFMALTGALVLAFDAGMVAVAFSLYQAGSVGFSGALICTMAFMSSFGPVIAVANLGSTLQQTFASGARVLDVLDEDPEVRDVEDGVDIAFDGAEARHVSFSYGAEPILDDVTLAIRPGSVVNIAGRSGSGKSTFLKLLMRFWDVSDGSIVLSDTDIRRINAESLRDSESYMTQETHLFSGTVRENLTLVKPDATDEELDDACRKAAILELIERLPKGYNTPVGELGDTLSGGERQRIGLARVFLYDAPFVLLDEPTSNLDSLNEAAVLSALEASKVGKTIVLVSHRASTCRFADVVYSVERGRVS